MTDADAPLPIGRFSALIAELRRDQILAGCPTCAAQPLPVVDFEAQAMLLADLFSGELTAEEIASVSADDFFGGDFRRAWVLGTAGDLPDAIEPPTAMLIARIRRDVPCFFPASIVIDRVRHAARRRALASALASLRFDAHGDIPDAAIFARLRAIASPFRSGP